MKLGLHEGTKPYRALLLNAWKTCITHKELWVFGFLAAAANSGAIFMDVLSAAMRLRPTDQLALTLKQSLNESLPEPFRWITDLLQLNAGAFTVTLASIVLALVIAVILVLVSQQLLLFGVHRSAKRKKHLPLRELKNELKHLHVLRLFAANALVSILLVLFFTGLSFPLMQLLSTTNALYNLFVYAGFYLFAIPVAFFVNSVGMFTLIHIIRHEQGLIHAIRLAIHTVSRHWLAIFELAVATFLLNLAAAAVGILAFSLIGIVYGVLAFTSFLLNTTLVYSLLSVFVLGLGATVFATFVGAITTFNYAVWMEAAERFERFGIMPLTERIRTTFSRS